MTEAEAEVVHRLAQYGRRGPLGIKIGIAAELLDGLAVRRTELHVAR